MSPISLTPSPLNPLPHTLSLVRLARATFKEAARQADPVRLMSWPVAPVDFAPALASARTGVMIINNTLGHASGRLSEGVRSALRSAASDAATGISLVTAKTIVAPNPATVAARFDSTANWLGIAESLLLVEMDTPRLLGS